LTITEAVICGEKLPAALGVPKKISPIIVPRMVPPHFLPVRDTRMAKKAGSKKKRSSDLVTDRSSMLETYP